MNNLTFQIKHCTHCHSIHINQKKPCLAEFVHDVMSGGINSAVKGLADPVHGEYEGPSLLDYTNPFAKIIKDENLAKMFGLQKNAIDLHDLYSAQDAANEAQLRLAEQRQDEERAQNRRLTEQLAETRQLLQTLLGR